MIDRTRIDFSSFKRSLALAFCTAAAMSASLWGIPQVPNSPPAAADQMVREGNALYDAGKYSEAVQKYLSAMAVAPDWYEPHYELGQTYYQMKRPGEAEAQFKLALKADPNCWICYQGMGNLADDSGNSALALVNYQKAVELAPDQAQPRYNLAIAYIRVQKVDEAISALKEAERIRPDYASPYFLLGKIYYQQHRLYLAHDQLFRATKLETSGSRFENAKKLTDFQMILDNKLPADLMGPHMSYCMARTAAMSPENYHKRFPAAETYVEDLHEEEYVLNDFATMVAELSSKKKREKEFERIVAVKNAGNLVPFILASSGQRFANDAAQFEKNNPGRLDEFRKWAAEKKISLEPVHARCEVQWMGQAW
jgi:tetratricopeptide (TPR) repeat protein